VLKENFGDRVVVHGWHSNRGWNGATLPSGVTAEALELTLPNGTKLQSSAPENVKDIWAPVTFHFHPGDWSGVDVCSGSTGQPVHALEWDVTFPRYLNGEPLLKPNDGKFRFGNMDFDTRKMIFRGKLEY
jgi:hypothetical protein